MSTSGHGGTALIGGGPGRGATFASPEIKCDCGRRFAATLHPVERDHVESPAWEQHVREARNATRPERAS